MSATLTETRWTGDSDPLRESKFPESQAIGEYRAWMDWLDVGQRSDSTQKEYGWIADKLMSSFPGKTFQEFNDADLLAVLKLVPPGSLDARVAGLRSWFKWGIKTRRRVDNPCDLLPDFKRPTRKIPVVFSRSEERALEGLPAPKGQLCTVLFETGLRRAEACWIRSRNFNLETRELTVREHTKGGHERVVGISQRLSHAIETLRILEGLNPNDFLWPTNPGGTLKNRHDKPKDNDEIRDWWVKCCEEAGVPFRRLHTTRHTYATRWRERGLPLEDLQAMLGHASPETTLMYAHTKVRDIVRRMDALPEDVD